jgi:cell division protein FtsB
MSGSKNKIKYFLVFLLGVAVASYFLFNQYGVLKYIELKSEQKKIKFEIEQIEKENYLLRKRIDSLNNIDYSIEKVAREKYNLKRKGEKVIKVQVVD